MTSTNSSPATVAASADSSPTAPHRVSTRDAYEPLIRSSTAAVPECDTIHSSSRRGRDIAFRGGAADGRSPKSASAS